MPNENGQDEFWKGRGAAFLLVLPAVPAFVLAFHASIVLGVAVALGFAAAGLWLWKRVDKRRLLISDEGLVVHTSSGTRTIPWKDAYYTCDAEPVEGDAFTLGEHVIDGLVITTFRLIYRALVRLILRRPRKYTATLLLHGPADTPISVGELEGVSDVEAHVLASIHGSSSDTSPFVLERDGLSHGGESLRFSELDRVVVDDVFRVNKIGGQGEWAKVALDCVHNPWSLIELLLKRGVVVEVHVEPPASIKPSIQSAQARQAGVGTGVRSPQ